jgi:methyl-accepting chemotaxis protein
MKLVRSTMILTAAALIGAVTMSAQGPPAPSPAPTGTTMAKTWTDDDLDKLMKEIGSTVGALRKAIDGQNAELAKTNADKMEDLFEQVDDFWSARNVKDAADTADDAAEHADHIEDAVEAKDFTKAAEHAKLLQGACASCHGKYRDKGPDGQYRIKP